MRTYYNEWGEQIAKRIRKAREEAGLTVDELAWLIHRSKSTLRKYEYGEKVPSIDAIIEIAEETNVSIDWLVGRKGCKRKHWN